MSIGLSSGSNQLQLCSLDANHGYQARRIEWGKEVQAVSQVADTWRCFITEAERAWLCVFDSARKTGWHHRDGAPLGRLPARFGTRRKIYNYFRRWWGSRLSSIMLCSLPLVQRPDGLYVILYDVPPVSLDVKEVRVVARKNHEIMVETWLDGGPEGRVRIHHALRYDSVRSRPMIVRRSDTAEDFRYQEYCRWSAEE